MNFRCGLPWVGPQDAPCVLHEASIESDRCGKEEGVKHRTIKALADVGTGGQNQKWAFIGLELETSKGSGSSLGPHAAPKNHRIVSALR